MNNAERLTANNNNSAANANGGVISAISIKGREVKLEFPPEIGDAVAYRTSVGEKSRETGFLAMSAAVTGLLIVLAIASFAMYEAYGTGAVAGVISSVCILIFLLLFFKKDVIGVIGTQGFAVYKFSKRGWQVTSGNTYLFKDASELVFSQVAQHVNAIYAGTSYKFRLSGKGKMLYKKSGSHNNRKNKEGKYGWKFYLLADIENAWTNFLLNDLALQLKNDGFVRFNKIELGTDYLKSGKTQIDKKDIKGISVNQGFLFVDHINHESKFLGLKTKGDRITVPVNTMPNRKAFLILLEHLTDDSSPDSQQQQE